MQRDLKPGNIMVSKDGLVKVLDFGLAKLIERSAALADGTNAPTEAQERVATMQKILREKPQPVEELAGAQPQNG